MTERERDVMAVFDHSVILGPTEVARWLNLEVVNVICRSVPKCHWCPVNLPSCGERCASVPKSSRDAVLRVIKKLVVSGHLQKYQVYRLPRYGPPGVV